LLAAAHVAVSRASIGATSCVVPRALARTGSSSPELDLRFRVRTAPHLLDTRMRRAPSLRFPSPSRHQWQRSTCGRVPTLTLRSVLDVSHVLDGFRPLLPRRLVSSCSHVRDFPFREFIPLPSRSVSSTARAFLSLGDVSYRDRSRHQFRPPRLQGLVPGSDPWRSPRRLAAARPDPLLGFLLLRAFLWISCRRLHASSARDLGSWPLRVMPRTDPQRFDRYPARSSISR
jgi:hypothetical protein